MSSRQGCGGGGGGLDHVMGEKEPGSSHRRRSGSCAGSRWGHCRHHCIDSSARPKEVGALMERPVTWSHLCRCKWRLRTHSRAPWPFSVAAWVTASPQAHSPGIWSPPHVPSVLLLRGERVSQKRPWRSRRKRPERRERGRAVTRLIFQERQVLAARAVPALERLPR